MQFAIQTNGQKNEQLDENQQEFNNIFGQIVQETDLLLKKFDEDEEGEIEKMLKNNIVEVIKLTLSIFSKIEMWKQQNKASKNFN